jgi:CelD/BcsL family acetyltransferase involved in cellulose biosynthesis
VKVLVHDQLDAVGAETWSALFDRSGQRGPYLGWTWQSEWVRTLGAERRLELWRVDDHGETIGLLPLFEAEPGLLRIIGGVDVSDYLDVMAVAGREEEVWAALLGARAASPTSWDLHAVPAASATLSLVPGLAGAFGLTATVAVEERCPVLSLPSSWKAYLASLTAKQRHELERKMRRLTREVPDAQPVWAETPEAIDARMGDFLDLHRRSRTGKARFMDSRMEAFFRRVTVGLAQRRQVRLWLLDSSAGPLAGFITLEWDGTVGLYNSGFNPARAALAPGIVLLGHLVRDAIERGRQRFDFLRGEERYKYEFGPAPEAVHQITIGPGGAAGD